ncbi:MAG: hypothetical protein ABR562_06985, partial [Thermoplasmatota archaeon]
IYDAVKHAGFEHHEHTRKALVPYAWFEGLVGDRMPRFLQGKWNTVKAVRKAKAEGRMVERERFLDLPREIAAMLAERLRRAEDVRDHREDRRDRREDVRDRAENRWDRRHHGGWRDRAEDGRDRREDRRDRREDVRDRAGVAWGTTVHHLLRLERHGLVVSVRHGNHRRYFPANTTASRHRRELSALSHPTAHRIATFVAANPGTDQKGVCRGLDLRNPAASKHLSRFDALGLVQAEVVGRSRLYHPTELLQAVLATLQDLGGLTPVRTERPAPRAPLAESLPDMMSDVAVPN